LPEWKASSSAARSTAAISARASIPSRRAAAPAAWSSSPSPAHTGTGGDENTLANFTYTFTDSNGITHTDIAPAQQRPKGTLLFGTHGTYDRLNNVLKDVDEVPDTGVCSASLAAVTGETPFFGF
jgi:hypothetical protein